MPQIGLGGQAAISGLLQGLIGGYGQQRQRSLEQERKGTEDQMKNLTSVINDYKHWQELDPSDPLRPLLEQKMTLAYGRVPGEFQTPLQRRRRDYVKGIGPDVTGYREFEKIGAPTGPIQPPAPPKPPSASSISAARRELEKNQEAVIEATGRISKMRTDWKLAPGEVPGARWDISKKEEKRRLDEWNKWNETLTAAQDSVSKIQRWATEKGVTLKFGAPTMPTPEEVSGMSDEEILRGLGGWNR